MVATDELIAAPAPPGPATRPWGWWHALLLQLAVILLAMPLEGRLHLHWTALRWPWYWIIVFAPVLAGVALGAFFRRTAWLRWLSGARFAVTNIALMILLGLLGILIIQSPGKADGLAKLGLRSMFTSFVFLAAILLMLLNLSTVIGRRLLQSGQSRLGFLLNHVGVVLVLAGFIGGKAQFADPMFRIAEGERVARFTGEQGQTYDLGAELTLQRFAIEKYPPRLAAEAAVPADDGHNHSRMVTDTEWVAKGRAFHAFGIHVEVLDFLPCAMPGDNGGWTPVANHGLPAAHVKIITPDGKQHDDWVTPPMETIGYRGTAVMVDDSHAIGMLESMPKAYTSFLTITEPGKSPVDRTLGVNHPLTIGPWWKLSSWTLYQSSYEVSMGSRASIIQAVRDPGLLIVYLGLVCMLLGSFVALWLTPRRPAAQRPESGKENA